MKTIGLIAGMSWESSVEYYRIINERISARLGGLHSAKCLMYSVDFADIETLQREGRWEEATEAMIECAQHLARGGADFLVVCTNTMHKMAEEVQQAVGLPLLHIADATGDRIVEAGIRTVGLLGTRFTMEEKFYTERLARRYGLEVLTPEADDRKIVHRVIYEELVQGITSAKSRAEYQRIIGGLAERGSEAVVLACTEIGLLITEGQVPIPVFDTTEIHAVAAADFALAN